MESNQCDDERINKIRNIIQREIQKEIANKQDEVAEITEKIEKALRNLDILKYVVALNYYENNAAIAPKKGGDQEDSKEKNVQTQLHPCVKKLLPFRSNFIKNIGDGGKTYETRRVTKTNSDNILESTITKTSDDIESTNRSDQLVLNNVSDYNSDKNESNKSETLQPKYVPPLPNPDIVKTVVNSHRGGSSKVQYRLIVGNVSKWIPPDTREDNSTHKWMVYIRNQDKDQDLANLIRKVRYFLHDSYKPHDIIDVSSSPFHLTRRGWGEFPVRVQLHFHHPLNKPVDVIHNLKLDMTCSGVQTLGAETIVELWLHPTNKSNNSSHTGVTKPTGIQDYANGKKTLEKCDVFDGNLLMSMNGIKNKSANTPAIAKNGESSKSPLKLKDTPHSPPLSDSTNVDSATCKPVLVNNNSNLMLDRRKLVELINMEHDYAKNENSSVNSNTLSDPLLKQIRAKTSEVSWGGMHKNGTVLESIKCVSRKNLNLNKFEVSNCKSENEIFRNLKSIINKLDGDSQSKYCMKVFKNGYLVNIVQRALSAELKTVEAFIKWFFKKWPIVTRLALDPMYKCIHPYSCPSEEGFFQFNIGKQRSAEWFRAKAIQKLLISLKQVIPINEEIWTTKQILMWSRFHGYSPISCAKVAGNGLYQSKIECQSKRLKLNEEIGGSSSDTDYDSSDCNAKKWKAKDERFMNGAVMPLKKKNFKRGRKKYLGDDPIAPNKSYRNVNMYSDSTDVARYGVLEYRLLECENSPEINVVNDDEEVKKVLTSDLWCSSKRKEFLDITTTPSDEVHMNKFICKATAQIGIKIMNEEIVPGVMCDSVVRVMSKITVSFLDELLRKSLAQAWLRNGDRPPTSLEFDDVMATLIEHPPFDIFTNRGLGVQPIMKTED